MAADPLTDIIAQITASPHTNRILTGPTNSGKSQFLERLVEALRAEFPHWKIGGLISRGVFFNSAKIAYEGIDCLSGATFLLTIKRNLSPEAESFLDQKFGKPASSPQGEEVGSWLLLEQGLTHATAAIQTAITARCNQVIIDEFGPLECEGKGLRPAADALMESNHPALLVVREKLLEEVQSLYSPFKIHYMG